jgi:molecular chaperone DnaK
MGYVIGIDLGTTNSVVSCLEAGKPIVMQNAEGQKTTPSVVFYRDDDEIVIGELAKRQQLIHTDRTIYSVKRFVGCRWDESGERRHGIDYSLEENPDGFVAVRIDDDLLLPEEVQAETLKKMKDTAEEYLGEEISQAVITCPAYFNDSQRQATKKAAELAGLEALRIINEPTAAALAYGIAKGENEKIAVFDFGGGTFDISILEIDEDVFEVKSTCGDTFLGGDTIDRIIVDYISGTIARELGLKIPLNPQAMSRVAEAAEKAKCELSSIDSTTITLPFIGADESGPKHLNTVLDRSEFEQMIAPVLDRLRIPCAQALLDAGLQPDHLNSVILVGGSTRIPAVQKLVSEMFRREPDRSVNPDEAVSLGAAIQGGIMNGELDEVILLDVTPLSLGIELAGGVFSALIQRNSSIPTSVNRKFTTVKDNQECVKVHVLQGERKMAKENRTLAWFSLEGVTPAPREVPEIEVSFTIDANGILQVGAMDLTSGNMTHIEVESYQAQAVEVEVNRVLEDAEAKVDEDRQFIRKLSMRRRLEAIRNEFTAMHTGSDSRNLSEELEQRMFQAIFKMEVSLTQNDWSLIVNADRDLQSVFGEIMMLNGLAAAAGAADDMMFQLDLDTDVSAQRPPSSPTDQSVPLGSMDGTPPVDESELSPSDPLEEEAS